MVRPIEQEIITIEKIVYYTHRSQEEGDTPCDGREAHWKYWCGQEMLGWEKGNMGRSLYCAFCGKDG